MSGLVLVAAGGLAREVLATLATHPGGDPDVVLLDDDHTLWGTKVGGAPVEGGLDQIGEHADREVLVCAGRGTARRAIVTRLAGLGVTGDRYATVLHPTVDVPPGCTVGAGSVLLAGCVLTADVRVGEHVVAMPHVTLTHDDVLEDFATLAAGVSLGGGVRVGEAAYVGMNASVREGVTLGAGSVLGMGAALLHDLPAGETWAGVPARTLSAASPSTEAR